jgi:ATP-dependent Lhr-like helicase
LLKASALVLLWREGYVEPLVPPPEPFHVVAQQLMALVLQQRGLGRNAWKDWLSDLIAGMQISAGDVEEVLTHMLSRQILAQDGNILGMGPEGERLYSGRNFMDLLSVFDTPPVFTVFHGLRDLGTVHPLSFWRPDGEEAILSLGGRAWEVTHIDFARMTAQVVPSDHFGRSRWLGEGHPLSFRMCQAIRRILLGSELSGIWSRRAGAEIGQAREESNYVAPDALVVERDEDKGRTTWWTFAGLLANAQLARAFTSFGGRPENLSVTLSHAILPREFLKYLEDPPENQREQEPDLPELVKFQDCLPELLVARMAANRSSDPDALASTRSAKLIFR